MDSETVANEFSLSSLISGPTMKDETYLSLANMYFDPSSCNFYVI